MTSRSRCKHGRWADACSPCTRVVPVMSRDEARVAWLRLMVPQLAVGGFAEVVAKYEAELASLGAGFLCGLCKHEHPRYADVVACFSPVGAR